MNNNIDLLSASRVYSFIVSVGALTSTWFETLRIFHVLARLHEAVHQSQVWSALVSSVASLKAAFLSSRSAGCVFQEHRVALNLGLRQSFFAGHLMNAVSHGQQLGYLLPGWKGTAIGPRLHIGLLLATLFGVHTMFVWVTGLSGTIGVLLRVVFILGTVLLAVLPTRWLRRSVTINALLALLIPEEHSVS